MSAAELKDKATLLPMLTQTVKQLESDFFIIPADRKEALLQLTQFVRERISMGQIASLNFICTHNSRRSHMAQFWAQAAANYYGIPGVVGYSGGTEATAFSTLAVEALRNLGFFIRQISEGDNPTYAVMFSKDTPPLKAFSKKYNDPFNPSKDFAAIMTCSHADENCPLVVGASRRFAITYDDPKDFDGTPQEEIKYLERALQIGREMLYVFSQVSSKL
jgi:arsenate reductase (thioredoxin)